MTKENTIREFIEDVEVIASSQVPNSKVVGLDFIAIGDDDDYFQDYLMHSKPIDDYLTAIDSFFEDNPSLLKTNLEYEITRISNENSEIVSSTIKLAHYEEKPIPKDKFVRNYTEGKEREYLDKWCKVISAFYPNCNSILFNKISFGSLDQTTALFIYFNTDISTLDDRRQGWLLKASKAFLYEEAVGVFMPKHVEKIKQEEEIERLRNVTASTHVIKTTINGLFGPILNSLRQENNVDPRIVELQKAKEKFIKYAEIINLMSKLSSLYKDEDEIKKSLTDSELFTEEKTKVADINSVLNEIKKLRDLDENKAKITFNTEGSSGLSEHAFVYANTHYPANSFYELLLLTIIENVVSHGAADDGKLVVNMSLSKYGITFSSKPKPNIKKGKFKPEDMTGNFRVFNTILTKLELGDFNVCNDKEKDEFRVTLKTKRNE